MTFNTTYTTGIYNEVDTVVVMSTDIVSGDQNKGGIMFYQKVIGGQWILGKEFTAEDLGLRPASMLGKIGTFVYQNTVVISAVAENSAVLTTQGGPAGKVIVMTRNGDGLWEQKFQLYAEEEVYLGYNTFVNKFNEIIVSGMKPDSLTGYVYSISMCVTDPINVTCHDVTLDNCTTLPLDTLYTVNNPRCGSVNGIIRVQLLEIGYDSHVQCNCHVPCS